MIAGFLPTTVWLDVCRVCSFHAKVQAENTGIAYEFLGRLRVAVVQTQLLPTSGETVGKSVMGPLKMASNWGYFTPISGGFRAGGVRLEVIVTSWYAGLFILSHPVIGRIQPTYIFLYRGYNPVTKYHGYPSTPPLQLTAGNLKLVVCRCFMMFLLFQGEFDSTSILVFGEWLFLFWHLGKLEILRVFLQSELIGILDLILHGSFNPSEKDSSNWVLYPSRVNMNNL